MAAGPQQQAYRTAPPPGGPASPPPPGGEAVPMALELSHNEKELLTGEPITMASSNVEAIAWRGGDPGELYVRFKDGSVYRYDGVPLALGVKFIESDSPGRFVWSHLRDRFPYAKIATMAARPKPNVVRLVNK